MESTRLTAWVIQDRLGQGEVVGEGDGGRMGASEGAGAGSG